MTSVPTSEIERAAAVLGPHATVGNVATAVGMDRSELRKRCAEEGIRIMVSAQPQAAAGARCSTDRSAGSASSA